jgi:hypothetical protein
MQGLAVMLFPAALILFALGMEWVEKGVRGLVLPEDQVQEFMDQADPAEVGALATTSTSVAIAKFKSRRVRADEFDDDDVEALAIGEPPAYARHAS